MKLTKFVAACSVALCMASGAQAATVSAEVFAKENSVKGGVSGLATGVMLLIGQSFSIFASPLDTWAQGKSSATVDRTTNANGRTDGKLFKHGGQSFILGSLVGKIGAGAYFLIGTSFSSVATLAGELQLFHWDSNARDNSGSIIASIDVATVPLPAGAPLLASGVAAVFALRRRKSA